MGPDSYRDEVWGWAFRVPRYMVDKKFNILNII
jgi:hypothetical protein